MKYANDDDLGYNPDAIEEEIHAREEEAWEEPPEADLPEDTGSYRRGVDPVGPWWEPPHQERQAEDREAGS